MLVSVCLCFLFLKTFLEAVVNTAADLSEALEANISFPSIDDWKKGNSGAGMDKYISKKKLLLFIDGTSANIRKPQLHSAGRDTYVHYKRHNAWRYFIVCLPSGEIVYLSDLWMGKNDDTKCYTESKLKELLEKEYEGVNKEGHTLCIGGDKGYVFIIPPDGWELILTQTAKKEMSGSDQTEIPSGGDPHNILQYSRTLDTDLAKPRSVIERSIGLLKRYRKLSGGQMRLNQSEILLCSMIVIAVAVANYFVKKGKDSDDDDESTIGEIDIDSEEEIVDFDDFE